MGRDTPYSRCPSCGAPSQKGALCDRCQGRTSNTGTSTWNPVRDSGILLEGKYRLLDEIGRGGMGTVFRAHDESLERTVAIKFLLPELQAEESLVERFRREAQAMASVRHQNVLQIFSFGRYGSANFFVMEYIDGQTTEDLLQQAHDRNEFIPLKQAVEILEQAASGLAAVHKAGVVHRDIKPANIMYEADSHRAVIMDFGIGKRYLSTDMRRTQSPCGTPAYMAPEVVSGKEISAEEDHLSDIYAFGVTAFELLTGVLPFEAENWVDLCVKHVTQPPPAPSTKRSRLPKELDQIVLKCLSKIPQERYESCAQLREAFLEVLEKIEPRSATPIPPTSQHKKSAYLTQNGTTGTAKNTRIIVADPDATFRYAVYQSAQDVFKDCKFQAAKTNTKALELALEAPPLLLVAQLDDPLLNGLELAATIWGHTELEAVKLVLTAERITAGERRMLNGMGVHKVLLKPVESKTITEIILDLDRSLSRPLSTPRGA
jgi:eukaryotic-like serine/threonine-protein kinase